MCVHYFTAQKAHLFARVCTCVHAWRVIFQCIWANFMNECVLDLRAVYLSLLMKSECSDNSIKFVVFFLFVLIWFFVFLQMLHGWIYGVVLWSKSPLDCELIIWFWNSLKVKQSQRIYWYTVSNKLLLAKQHKIMYLFFIFHKSFIDPQRPSSRVSLVPIQITHCCVFVCCCSNYQTLATWTKFP